MYVFVYCAILSFSYNGYMSCILLFRDPTNYKGISWLEAEDICRKDGATLASIMSKDDLDTVKFHFQYVANIYGQFVYIGLQKFSNVSIIILFFT